MEEWYIFILQSVLTAAFLLVGLLIKNAVYKGKKELIDIDQYKDIEEIKMWQNEHSLYSQRVIKDISLHSTEISKLDERIKNVEVNFNYYRNEQMKINSKITDQLDENNKIIAHLDGTLSGLKPLIEQIFKQNNK